MRMRSREYFLLELLLFLALLNSSGSLTLTSMSACTIVAFHIYLIDNYPRKGTFQNCDNEKNELHFKKLNLFPKIANLIKMNRYYSIIWI